MIRAVLLGLPGLLLAGWLLSKLPPAFSGEPVGRPWTLGQRLLTEPRVLWDYLHLLWLPQASGSSVFNDDFRASTGWLEPWSTLPALLGIGALLGAGLWLRGRQPALAFAILFYLAGQLLESTVIPLELYFEHRNYLPSLPMFWPLALWLAQPGTRQRLRLALAAGLLIILGVLCHVRAGIWGHPYEQALLLAQVNPDSPRAQANAATFERSQGRPDLAAARLERVSRAMPEEAQIALNWVAADCQRGELTPAARAAAHYALAHNRGDTTLARNWLTGAIDTAKQQACPGLDLTEVDTMVALMRDNPDYPRSGARLAEMHELAGRLRLAHGDGPGALQEFNSGIELFAAPDRALLQAALLGSAGFPALGQAHLRWYETLQPVDRLSGGMPGLHQRLLQQTGYWQNEITHMEAQLAEDAAAGPAPAAGTRP